MFCSTFFFDLRSGNGHNLRFADWDSDGDVDVLLAENDSLWFYERFPGDSFYKHKLMTTNLSIWDGFEVADWDGDRQLFDSYFFLRKRVRFLFFHMRKFKIVWKGFERLLAPNFPSKICR